MTSTLVSSAQASERAVAAAVVLDRISQARYGERLAEVQVGDEIVDLRQFDRRPRPRRRTR